MAEKVGRVRRMLAAEVVGGLLLGAQRNFSWLPSGGSNGIDQSRDASGDGARRAAHSAAVHEEPLRCAAHGADAHPRDGRDVAAGDALLLVTYAP